MAIYNLRPANPHYQELVNRATRKLNMNNIPVFAGDVDNAVATHRKRSGHYRGLPIIVYNEEFMQELYEYNPWSVYFVLAHEVAHHYNKDLYGHFWFFKRGIDLRSHRQELNADFIAGWILRCEGASFWDTIALAKALDLQESYTHPDESKRILEMKKGWNRGNCDIVPQRKIIPKQSSNSNFTEVVVGVGAVALIFAGIAALVNNK